MAKPGLPQIPDDQAESVRQHVQRIDASSRKGRLELQHEALDSPVVVGDPLEELGSGVDALERAGADAVHTGFHDAVAAGEESSCERCRLRSPCSSARAMKSSAVSAGYPAASLGDQVRQMHVTCSTRE